MAHRRRGARRQRSAAEIAEILEEFRRNGLSQRRFVASKEFCLSTLRNWLRKAKSPSAPDRRGQARARREERWREVLAAQRASGLSHVEFSRANSIALSSYYHWKREIEVSDGKCPEARTRTAGGKEDTTPSLVPVTISKPGANPARVDSHVFEVVLSRRRVVRVRQGFDGETLKRLVAVLEEEETC